MNKFGLKKLLPALACMALALVACKRDTPEPVKPVAAKPSADVITVVTINSPNTYYVNNKSEFAGLEYDLATLFAEHLGGGMQVKFIVATSIESALESLLQNKADIAAADLSITEERLKTVNFSMPYQDVQQQLVYNTDTVKSPPKSLKNMNGAPIVVPSATSFAERLREITQTESNIVWEERKDIHSEALLEAVASADLEYTIADNHLISVLQNYRPNLGVAFNVGKPEQIAWAFARNDKKDLLKKANAFFAQIKQDGTLRNLIDRYHGNSKRLKPIDVKSFLLRTQTLLPQYKRLFKQAQDVTNLDWRLLAAISYQESHWDTFNTSPTNVRGLMMLTEDTADRMGVTDRLDPKQSIPAGAKYVAELIDTVPNRILEPDRTYMALAAYNIGYAHVEDARVLAQRLKMNPDSWADVKKTLVMLNDPKYYSNAKYGYCSGGAPVIFVESIRSYYNILSRYQAPYDSNQDSFRIAGAAQNLVN